MTSEGPKWFVVLIAVALLGVPLPAVAQEAELPTLLGMASGPDWREDLDAVNRETGRYPAMFQMFRAIDGKGTIDHHDWTSEHHLSIRVRTQAWFDDVHERGMVPYIEVRVRSEEALDQLLSGELDEQFQGFVDTITDWLHDGRRILIAPFPEANNRKHAWGGDPGKYRDAYNMLRNAIVQQASPQEARFVFAVNGLADLDYETNLNGYKDFYPGDDVVDLVGFAKLNRGEPRWRDYERTFTLHISEMRETVTLTKPILITQTGSVESGEDGETRSEWLGDMFSGLKDHSQVIGATYFNRNKADGVDTGEVFDYRLVADGVVDPTLDNSYPTWSDPSQAEWIFDGRMDQWVADREAAAEAGFVDTIDSVFAADIAWLAGEAITVGCNPPENDRFCPDDPVTRGQMAAFLKRFLDLPAASTDYFADDEGSTFEADINAIAEAGITHGCNPPDNTNYCPDDEVDRGEMAAFIVRALGLSASNHSGFDDVATSNTFHGDIAKLATAEITRGCNPPDNTNYCPNENVTRGQMAAFLHRAAPLVP